MTDLVLDEDGNATAVVCGEETFPADAVVFAVGISGMQNIVASRCGAWSRLAVSTC